MNIPKALFAAGFPARAIQVIQAHRAAGHLPRAGYDDCLDGLSKRIGQGMMVAVIGGRGLGKTVMGTELASNLLETGKTVRYSTLNGFLLEISATWKKDSRMTEMEVIEKYRAPQFLVWDETGKSGGKSWEDRFVFELLDKRYCDMADTLLLSNHSKDQFTSWLGPSLASRMMETGTIVEARWEMLRKAMEEVE